MSTPAEVVECRVICHECGTIWRLDPGEEMPYCDRCGSKQLSRETHFTVDQTPPEEGSPHAEPRS